MRAGCLCALWLAVISGGNARAEQTSPRFEISFPSSLRAQPVTGRVFLLISRTNQAEVRLQSTWYNSPEMAAVDVKALKPGEPAIIDASTLATPLTHISELAAAEYYVQAVLNVYTKFHRADGHMIFAHADQWEGQNFSISPGNLYSKVVKLRLESSETHALSLTEVIPPIQSPTDTQWVKHIKLESALLTRFWGKPIYLGATILLPEGYETQSDRRYPAIYFMQQHFNLAAPFGFNCNAAPESEEERQDRLKRGYESAQELCQAWQAKNFPRMVAISFQHPTPFGDMSDLVNSVNNGPYGDAVMQELIPYLERHFRLVREPYARVLTGWASGGRDALTLQLRHAEFFSGAWIFDPWAFDFRRYFTLNIYDNDNAFTVKAQDLPPWTRNPSLAIPVERQFVRTPDGIPIANLRQVSQHDAVMGSKPPGGEFGADDAILGPMGEDGYPRSLWDRLTGQIDPEVAHYWRENADLTVYAQRNWPRIGKSLVGKLHFYVGEMDEFERNNGVHLFEEFLKTTASPHYAGSFEYACRKGSWQPLTKTELIRRMAEHIVQNAPTGADLFWSGSK